MFVSSRILRFVLPALLAVAALIAGPPTDASAGIKFKDGPKLISAAPTVGEPATFSATAVFPGEEWIGFQWDFGDQTELVGGVTFQSEVKSSPSHIYTEPGNHQITCVAYHGYKSGVFGVGPFKFRSTRRINLFVAPSLPLRVGQFTIDGDKIESANKQKTQYLVSGNVRLNGLIALGNPVLVDTAKQTLQLSGTLSIPGAGDYAQGLSFLKNVTLDAKTGGFASVDLPSIMGAFEVAGFAAKLENVRIVGAGIEFDFEVRIPRLTQDPSDPQPPPIPGAPIDLGKVFPPKPTPQQLAALSFKQFRVDTISPFLHPLGETKATISNIQFGVAGTKYGLETLEAGVDPSQKRYFGTLKIKLPADRAVGGTFEMREHQLEKIGLVLDGKIPFWTFTGGLDAIYIRTLAADFIHLAELEGQEPRTPAIQAGTFDPISGEVITPGIVLEWGPATNLIGKNILTPIKLTGAGTFDHFWNVQTAGQLSFFEDVFGPKMRLLQAQGAYAAPQDGRDGGTWTFRGDLVFDSLFTLQATLGTSFDPNDYHTIATASGTTLLPSDHWISAIVPNINGTVTWLWRIEPHASNKITFHGTANIPATYPVLRRLVAGKGIGFTYNFETDEYSWQVIDVFTETTVGKAASRSGVVANGAGAGGLIVTLQHSTGAGSFNLRLPGGTLLTPADNDGIDVDYIATPTQSMYVLDSAADGTYTAEFDDAGLGQFDVQFFSPRPLPEVSVDGISADTSIGRYEPLDVPFSTVGIESDATVRVYLDDDEAPGGGVLVATGDATATTLTADASNAAAGQYRLVVEVTGSDGHPEIGEAVGRVTVRDHVALTVTKGVLKDGAKSGRDKLVIKGTLDFDGPSPDRVFDHTTENLRLTLGSDADPFELRIPAGDIGWRANKRGTLRWKSARGVTPGIVLSIDPVKGKFSVKLAKADFSAPPVNPIHCDLLFGNDAASDTVDWTETSPGKFVR